MIKIFRGGENKNRNMTPAVVLSAYKFYGLGGPWDLIHLACEETGFRPKNMIPAFIGNPH